MVSLINAHFGPYSVQFHINRVSASGYFLSCGLSFVLRAVHLCCRRLPGMSLHVPPLPFPSSHTLVSPSAHQHPSFPSSHLSPFFACSLPPCFVPSPSPLRFRPPLQYIYTRKTLPDRCQPILLLGFVIPRMHASTQTLPFVLTCWWVGHKLGWQRSGSVLFIGSYTINWVHTIHLGQWWSWVFGTQERNKKKFLPNKNFFLC